MLLYAWVAWGWSAKSAYLRCNSAIRFHINISMRFEDKIPHIDKVANFIVGLVLAYLFIPVFGHWLAVALIILIATGKELWWDRNYDINNVDWWDFIAVMAGCGLGYIII
jgi:uncharacterized membrane protein